MEQKSREDDEGVAAPVPVPVIDPNNNNCDPEAPSQSDLVETINGRLARWRLVHEKSQSKWPVEVSNENNDEEYDDDDIVAAFSEENDEESAPPKDDGEEEEEEGGADEPYDVDKVLISTFLEHTTSIAEARLAARRQARAEAREIRMRELERQQKEQEQNADRVFDMQTAEQGLAQRTRYNLSPAVQTVNRNNVISRRSSEDSVEAATTTEEGGRNHRDLRYELKDLEDRFRKAMIANAQMDNERASQAYQIQLLKDKLEDVEEARAQLNREHREKCREFELLKRANAKLQEEYKLIEGQLNERDSLIAERGMVIVLVENEDGTDAKRTLVSLENADLLATVQGSLDVRLKKLNEEKQRMETELTELQEQVAELRSQRRSGSMNGPFGEDWEDMQRETQKQITEYRFKLQKAEQEITTLQSSLARAETQVIRYKSTADASEKSETELKRQKAKLQREHRELSERVEELETANSHLTKRLDKLKNAKSALLKEI